MVTLFNILSEDGFIARNNGEEDFIPDELWPHTLEFFKQYDAFVMGRKTYEAIQKYDPALLEPFEALSLQKVVVSHLPLNLKSGYVLAHSPEEMLARLSGKNALVSSGPGLNSELLQKGLIEKVIWQIVPVKIGEGIRPFAEEVEPHLVPTKETEGPLHTKIIEYRPVVS